MQQIQSVWSDLSIQKRLVAGLAVMAMVIAGVGLARMATNPSMSLLYAGLETGAAGDVVAALEARGVDYSVRGTSIFVDSVRRDELRMTLASEGLPANASQGYELLDQMTGFGTTSQMFDAAYWRAKEGELARTIVSSPAIQSARVHLANPVSRPFQRGGAPTASVTVTPAQNGLSANHARALRYMVASAVSGLSPDDVSVIDATGGVIIAGQNEGPVQGDGTDKAAILKRNVERLLEARVGYGNAVVEVNVATVTDSEQITERRIDPDSRVAISQEKTETTSSEQGRSGDVTVASNLPDGDADAQGDEQRAQQSESRERTNFEISEIQREVLRSPGAIERITTAVLIDGLVVEDADGGRAWQPRPAEEMEALRELVSAVVGFDAERGDSLSIQTMEFEPLPVTGSEPGSALSSAMKFDVMRLAQLGILAVITLLIGLFVVRPILTQRPPVITELPPPPGSDLAALTGEIDPVDTPEEIARLRSVAGPGAAAPDAAVDSGSAVERLRSLIDERQDESLQILRSWMEEDREEKA